MRGAVAFVNGAAYCLRTGGDVAAQIWSHLMRVLVKFSYTDDVLLDRTIRDDEMLNVYRFAREAMTHWCEAVDATYARLSECSFGLGHAPDAFSMGSIDVVVYDPQSGHTSDGARCFDAATYYVESDDV